MDIGKEVEPVKVCDKKEEGPPKQTIKIYFNRKFYEFKNWGEAQKHGFYLIQ